MKALKAMKKVMKATKAEPMKALKAMKKVMKAKAMKKSDEGESTEGESDEKAEPMKALKAMKQVMKAKALKAMKKKAMKKSVVAKGKLAKAMVLRGSKLRTSGGLKKENLKKNKAGRIVFKAASDAKKKAYAGSAFQKWNQAVQQAKKVLKLKGMVFIGGKTAQGRALYAKATAIYKA